MKVWINATNNIVWNPNIDSDLDLDFIGELFDWTHSFHDRILWGQAYGGVWMILE